MLLTSNGEISLCLDSVFLCLCVLVFRLCVHVRTLTYWRVDVPTCLPVPVAVAVPALPVQTRYVTLISFTGVLDDRALPSLLTTHGLPPLTVAMQHKPIQ